MTKPKKIRTEVIVVGSGGAALTAAIVAHDHGAKVVLIEKTSLIGGSTAVSGGAVWAPNHAINAFADTREEALTYLRQLVQGRIAEELLVALVDNVPLMVKHMQSAAKMNWVPFDGCDYHSELEGGKATPGGRSLDSGLFDTNELGDWKSKLRPSPLFGAVPMTMAEAQGWKSHYQAQNVRMDILAERYQKGIVGFGRSLVGKLLKALLERGIEPMLETRATELMMGSDGIVAGLRAKGPGGDIEFHASKAVILASGGFDWNPDIQRQFLPAPIEYPMGPTSNTGDGLIMSMAVGARLGMMNEVWAMPAIQIPGEEYDGQPLSRHTLSERGLPHSIMVNSAGKRFVDEACNYNDIGKIFNAFDPVNYCFPNRKAWLILSQQYFDKYSFATVMPGDKVPEWINRAETPEQLGKALGIDPVELRETIARFNGFAETGKDLDFHRGESDYDLAKGDPEHGPNPNLGALTKGPYYGVRIYPSAIGTKGGPVVNASGQVMHVSGRPIEGLYAAGNVTAVVTGPAYGGPGGTLGPTLTFGYICGKHAANAVPRKKTANG